MKALALIAIVLLVCLLAIPNARGALGMERPPGVAEQAWVPMGDAAGFVVTGKASSRNAPTQRDSALSIPRPALRGYFAVKRGSTWYRLDTVPEPGALPANQ